MDNFFKGSFGASGSGRNGAQGSQGIQGVMGNIGSQGTQGAQGTIGGQGVQGLIGNNGSQGVQGVLGVLGIQGAQGAQGNNQIQGAQGTIGIGGLGSQGIQGTIGNSGFYTFYGTGAGTLQVANKLFTQPIGSATQVANLIVLGFMKLVNDYTFTSIIINVTTALAGQLYRVVIYDNNESIGRPNNKIYESADIDGSTTGNKVLTLSALTFLAGKVYFIGSYALNAGGNLAIANQNFNPEASPPSVTNPWNFTRSYTISATFRSAPNPVGSSIVNLAQTSPISVVLL